MKPAAVTSVPVSIGKAVEVQAKEAARSRSQPCSSFTTIISIAMIASSTSRPSAMISAPSVTRWRSRPMQRHDDEDDRQHQRHGRRDDDPRSPAEAEETHAEHDRERLEQRAGELADRRIRPPSAGRRCARSTIPRGRPASNSASAASRLLPSARMLPPFCMTTPISSAGWPCARMR